MWSVPRPEIEREGKSCLPGPGAPATARLPVADASGPSSQVRREQVQRQADAGEEQRDAQAPPEPLVQDLVPPVVTGRGVDQADHYQEHRQVPVNAHGEECGHHRTPPGGLVVGVASATGGAGGGGRGNGLASASPFSSSSHFGGSRNIGPASAS